MIYKELKEELIRANTAYYMHSQPIMSDYEFDMKLKNLEKIEAQQGFRDADSPTISPGSDISLDVKNDISNSHKRPMESLENTYNKDDVTKWYNDMCKATGEKNPEVLVNPKWDGNSGALRFDKNGLYKALTRGSGTIGEDISQNMKYCSTHVWKQMKFRDTPFIGETRGEIIMSNSGFDELNKDAEYQNARNLVSGSLKLLDINEFALRAKYIIFCAYWLENSVNKTYEEDLRTLNDYGFFVGPYYLCHSLDEIFTAIDKVSKYNFEVAIDGAVMKLNEKKYWNKIGSTSKYPRWAKAYKYKQQSIQSKITKIEFWVGRTGKITPVAWFEPVFIDGSTIQKATLNNKDFYDAMDVAIGDTVEVQKAAAIIPQIISVVNKPSDRKKIDFPKVCPECGSSLVKHNEDQADYYCENDNCPARIVNQIVNYTHTLEIDGFAEILVERLHTAGLLNKISDLYNLKNHKAEIAALERMSDKTATKLCENIEKSKTAEFYKLLGALGIQNVGIKTAKLITAHFHTIDDLSKASKVEIESIDGIAGISATSILNWLDSNKELIKILKDNGVNMASIEESKQSTSLSGKIFCITGALSEPRNKIISLIESNGGSVVSGVSKKVNYLITNDKTTGTSKNKAARELGISIINEEEFKKLF